MAAAAKPSPLFPPTRTLRVDSAGTPTLEQEGVAVIRENLGSRYSMPYGTLAIYCSLSDALICFCTNLCLYTHAFGGAGLGDTPGHPPSSPRCFFGARGDPYRFRARDLVAGAGRHSVSSDTGRPVRGR